LWMGRADRWQTQVIEQWNETHTLPTAEEAGLPATTQKEPEKVPKKPGKWWKR